MRATVRLGSTLKAQVARPLTLICKRKLQAMFSRERAKLLSKTRPRYLLSVRDGKTSNRVAPTHPPVSLVPGASLCNQKSCDNQPNNARMNLHQQEVSDEMLVWCQIHDVGRFSDAAEAPRNDVVPLDVPSQLAGFCSPDEAGVVLCVSHDNVNPGYLSGKSKWSSVSIRLSGSTTSKTRAATTGRGQCLTSLENAPWRIPRAVATDS